MHSSGMRTVHSGSRLRGGGCASWGVCFPGGVLPGGCVLPGGGCIPACTEADPPREQNDRQVKTQPLQLRCGQ